MKSNHVWIVEIKNQNGDGWTPTVGCALTKKDGQAVLAEWQSQNRDDTFRLKWYRSV